MKTTTRARQRGAVVILVGFVLIVLIGFAGLVIDLGRLYVAKTELQNAADAAALAGAKLLDGTALGVQKAVHGTNNNNTLNGAIYTAGLHRYDFTSKPVTITIANISVGDCPDDSCMVAASSVTSDAIAAGKTFLKVDTSATGQQTFSTFLMQVLRIFAPGTSATTQTFGLAVAGRFTIDVAPIGVCAINKTQKGVDQSNGANNTGELLELGFRRGIAYNIFELNPIGSNGVPIWINPVDTPPNACNPANGSANTLLPFLCTGHSALNFSGLPNNQFVYVNTGLGGATQSQNALNSRFGDNSKCDPGTAPPDSNIKSYDCVKVGGNTCNGAVGDAGLPFNWMELGSTNIPTQQGITMNPTTHLPYDVDASGTQQPTASRSFGNYGALWSYAWARNSVANADFSPTTANWSQLYGSTATVDSGYPTTLTPYAQGSGSNYFKPGTNGQPNRRVLNIAILDCSTLSGGGLSCSSVKVLGLGKFFMTVRAAIGGGKCSPTSGANVTSCLYGEFGGLITPIPTAEIRLYR